MNTAILIPARFGSTRLPGKLLLAQTGKPLIQHTWEQAIKVRGVDAVFIATDDDRIAKAVERFGGQSVMTDSAHQSGSGRIAQAAQNLAVDGKKYDIIINLQGDEPEINPDHISALIENHKNANCFASTLACPFPTHLTTGPGSPEDPAAVKVVMTNHIEKPTALYFSRSKIPHADNHRHYMHVGIYAYTFDALIEFSQTGPSPLEKAESLEQLRILEMGKEIGVLLIDKTEPGIDTAQDYSAFVERYKNLNPKT